MTLVRKLQYNEHQHGYFSIIPKGLVEGMGWKKGDSLRFSIDGKNLTITLENNKGCTGAIK